MRLRSNLLVLAAGTVLPLTALALVLGYLLVEQERDTFRRGAIDRNRAFMTAVDAEIRGHITTLQAVAAATSLKSDDLRTFHRDIQQVLASQHDWRNIIPASASGQPIVPARQVCGATLPTTSAPESF